MNSSTTEWTNCTFPCQFVCSVLDELAPTRNPVCELPYIQWCGNSSTVFHKQGLHPRLVTEGFEVAKNQALQVLDEVRLQGNVDRDLLISVARTSLRTKVHPDLADILNEVSSGMTPESYCFHDRTQAYPTTVNTSV